MDTVAGNPPVPFVVSLSNHAAGPSTSSGRTDAVRNRLPRERGSEGEVADAAYANGSTYTPTLWITTSPVTDVWQPSRTG